MKRSTRSWCTGVVALALATPAFAGPPFLTDDPAPTPNGHYEIYLFAAGNEAPNGDDGAAGLDFNYGASPDLQLTAALPIEYDNPGGDSASMGVGNIELAAKYRILHQETFGLDVALFPRLFLPSASNLGDDHASFLLPIWVGREGDSWSTFGGGGCAINRGGDSQDYCLAGWAVTQRPVDNLQLGVEIFHQTADTKDGEPSTILGVGVTYDVNENLHLLGYAGAGLENTDETGRSTGYASILFTF